MPDAAEILADWQDTLGEVAPTATVVYSGQSATGKVAFEASELVTGIAGLSPGVTKVLRCAVSDFTTTPPKNGKWITVDGATHTINAIRTVAGVLYRIELGDEYG